jgi:putative ABC transport system substrate-binding protein
MRLFNDPTAAFIAGLGSAAAWPVVARAQQAGMPVIGLLQTEAPFSWNFTGFRQGLKDMGYLEGQSLAIEFRWANNDPDRLPGLAAAGFSPLRMRPV